MRFSPLCSGSSGNASYLEADGARLLIDAGGTGKRIESLLEEIGVSASSLDAILLTHEHIDHVQGVGVLSRRYDLPVFAAADCFAALPPSIGGVAPARMRVFEPDHPFFFHGLQILPFSVPHDSARAVGYTFEDAFGRCAILTDVGCISEHLMEILSGSGVLLLEANHDVDMLLSGSYPYPLKRRILSQSGHLCNEDAASAIVRLAAQGTREFILGHLSRENNTPDLAAVTVRSALTAAGFGGEVRVTVARRDHATGTFAVSTPGAEAREIERAIPAPALAYGSL